MLRVSGSFGGLRFRVSGGLSVEGFGQFRGG